MILGISGQQRTGMTAPNPPPAVEFALLEPTLRATPEPKCQAVVSVLLLSALVSGALIHIPGAFAPLRGRSGPRSTTGLRAAQSRHRRRHTGSGVTCLLSSRIGSPRACSFVHGVPPAERLAPALKPKPAHQLSRPLLPRPAHHTSTVTRLLTTFPRFHSFWVHILTSILTRYSVAAESTALQERLRQLSLHSPSTRASPSDPEPKDQPTSVSFGIVAYHGHSAGIR